MMKTFQYFANNQLAPACSRETTSPAKTPPTAKSGHKSPTAMLKMSTAQSPQQKPLSTKVPWGKMLPAERGRYMRKIGDVISKHADRLGEIETRDNGKLPKAITPGLKERPMASRQLALLRRHVR